MILKKITFIFLITSLTSCVTSNTFPPPSAPPAIVTPLPETVSSQPLKTEFFSWNSIPTPHPKTFAPPRTDVKDNIPRSFFVEPGQPLPSLKDVFYKIESALESHSPKYSYQVYKYRNGFAILTDDELIDRNGKIRLSRANERLLPERKDKYGFFRSFLNLFNESNDRFRYFAFIVSTGAIPSSREPVTPELLQNIYTDGSTRDELPFDILAEHAFTEHYSVQVRVYEFKSSNYLEYSNRTTDQNTTSNPQVGFQKLPLRIHKNRSNLLKVILDEM